MHSDTPAQKTRSRAEITHPNRLQQFWRGLISSSQRLFCSIDSPLWVQYEPGFDSHRVDSWISKSPTMSTTRTLFRSTRPIFQTRAPFFAQTQNAFSRSTTRAGRRFQSTGAPAAEAATKSWAAQFWASPVGPKTVHFWYV